MKSRVDKSIYKYKRDNFMSRRWFKNGFEYREKGLPAYIGSNGTSCWFNETGNYHKDNGPAIIFSDGSKRWYNHGILARIENEI